MVANCQKESTAVVLVMYGQNVDEMPVRLIKFGKKSSKLDLPTISFTKQVVHSNGNETRLINCFSFENNEVLLLLDKIILFFDETLKEIKSIPLYEIDSCIQSVNCCALDYS